MCLHTSECGRTCVSACERVWVHVCGCMRAGVAAFYHAVMCIIPCIISCITACIIPCITPCIMPASDQELYHALYEILVCIISCVLRRLPYIFMYIEINMCVWLHSDTHMFSAGFPTYSNIYIYMCLYDKNLKQICPPQASPQKH